MIGHFAAGRRQCCAPRHYLDSATGQRNMPRVGRLNDVALPKGWIATDNSVFESGQSWVHQVTHAEMEGVFALKILKNPKRVSRFSIEIATVNFLIEQGVDQLLPVTSHDLSAARPWFATRWIGGGSLDSGAKRDSMTGSIPNSAPVLIDLARVLSAIHANDFAHRDVKPANILMDDDRLVLADFGLVLPVDQTERNTSTLEAIGSRRYIAPENEDGLNLNVDQRSCDFYSFGKVAYALLAGAEPPAREPEAEKSNTLAQLLPGKGMEPVDALIAVLVDKDPTRRLTDWGRVVEELTSLLGAPTDTQGQGGLKRLSELEQLSTQLALSSVAAGADLRAEELRRAKEATDEVMGIASRAIRSKLTDDLNHLTSASSDKVKFQIASGGAAYAQLSGVNNGDRLKPPEGTLIRPDETQRLLVGIVPDSGTWPRAGTLYLGLYFFGMQERVKIRSFPYIQSRQGPLVPTELLHAHLREVDIELPLLDSSQDVIEDFIAELAGAFEDLAVRCLEALGLGLELKEARWDG